jgi:MFS transporter, PAT family, beta-lactamase induction signal transducer AmpG
MLYMIMIVRGENQTAHYAICTGFMALGMMLRGMAAAKLFELRQVDLWRITNRWLIG